MTRNNSGTRRLPLAPGYPDCARASGWRRLLGVALLSVLAVAPARDALAGAGGTTGAPVGSAPAPRRGGVFRFINEETTSLDPWNTLDTYTAVVCFQIFRGLLVYNTNLSPMPDVARTWTISRDGRHYTFELNRGVLFHNGREVTAADFVYSFERIYRPGRSYGLGGQLLIAIEGAKAYHDGRAPNITGISAPSRYTLEIRLSRPDASFLWSLAMVQAAVVPREVIERLGEEEFARHPVGCGPFQFIRREPGVVRLAAFDRYYRTRAWVDSLCFVTPFDYARVEGADALIRREGDFSRLPAFRVADIARLPHMRVMSRRELNLTFIGMNTRMPPFDNPDVREAFACSVDREAAIRLDPSGQVMATGLLPPGISCYSPEVRTAPLDLERARQALVRAGYPGGRGLPKIRFNSPLSSARRHLVDSVMVAGWRQLGIPVELEHLDWTVHNRRLDERNEQLFTLSWMADTPDPDSFLGSLYDSRSPSNMFNYVNPAVDSLLQQGRTTVDLRARQAIYGATEKIILKEAPIIPLFTRTTSYAIRDCYHGFELTPLGIQSVDLSHVWYEPSEDVTHSNP